MLKPKEKLAITNKPNNDFLIFIILIY